MPDHGSQSLVDHYCAVFSDAPDDRTYRFLVDGEGEPVTLTNAEFDRRARAVAAALRERVPAGERALIVCPPGLDYVVSFYACLYAGIIAVPVYPPDPAFLKRTLPRLVGVIDDAQPAVVLAQKSMVEIADRFTEYAPGLADIAWFAVDDVELSAAEAWRRPEIGGDAVAFLQYTSGSTRRPKGVIVSHGNLASNMTRMMRQLQLGRDTRAVSWLPPYHDMGLILGLLTPAYAQFPVVFMSPFSFLKRPLRWLRAISDHGGTFSGGPNFAYDLCVTKTTEEERRELDLSTWHTAVNGAEPVRRETLDRFSRTFASCGFRPVAHAPGYGLAEATLMVSVTSPDAAPVIRQVHADALAAGEIADAGPDDHARTVIGCGLPFEEREGEEQRVVIADPQTRERLPDGHVGEIWVDGPSVAKGYWRNPEETAAVFGAHLAGTGEGPFMRTGDLGFLDGPELYVTGRIKDVIIIAGSNHYPQDIERSVEEVGPELRRGCGIAGTRDVDGEERLIVVQELNGAVAEADGARLIAGIRAKVAEEHGLQVHDVALVRRGMVPKTSSGKLQRSRCLDSYVDGSLPTVVAWRSGETQTPQQQAPAAAPEPSRSRTEIEQHLREELAGMLGTTPDQVDPETPFAALGLRSAELVTLVGRFERWLGHELSPTVVWAYPTLDKLAEALATGAALRPAESRPAATEPQREEPAPAAVDADRPGAAEPVAIVGIGCRFPGGADGPQRFWQLLCDGTDAISEVPADRWDVAEYLDEDPSTPGKTNTRWGGFVAGVDLFDRQFFGISHQEAVRMDPQQRLLAEVTWDALQDAGVPTDRLAGSSTGVFVGISSFDYANRQLQDLDTIDAYTGTGSAFSVAANRLSYLLDLHGPSMAVDTACSSSLVAVVQACNSLARGECDMAIAGGVNLVLSPALAINFAKAGVMSPDGRCKSFDARADGYVRSDGAGAVVLKPLSRALADHDPIYAVIRGGAVNQDGASNGIMAPNPHAQQAVVRAALANAGVRPEQVRYVETHGSGTMLGDPIEAKALGAALGTGRTPDDPCLIGSVKTNVGHMEAAAGIGGLIKTALMVQHRTIPASLHYEQPNPHIPFDELALRVAATRQPWPDGPAIAGVSSFGFGGTNAHLVVEEPPRTPAPARPTADGAHLLALSARSDKALRELAAGYEARLAAPADGLTPGALAFASTVRRAHHEFRLACVGSSLEEFRTALAAFGRGEEVPGLSCGEPRVGRRPRTAFLFSGQGPRWWPLAKDLLDTEPVFRESLERSDALLRAHVDWSLLDQLTSDRAESLLMDTAVGQPALCAVQIALAGLWRSWGVEPSAVAGHSVGEIAAAQVAGALSQRDALLIALHRGRALHAAAGKGRMAVVGVPVARAREILEERGATAVWVAASNSPNSAVFSGEAAPLRRLAEDLEAGGVYCRVLESVEFASHSPLMEPVAAELRQKLSAVRPAATAIPMISTVTGEPADGTRLDAGYWADNLTHPVLFDAAVTRLAGLEHDVFVEISPHPMLGDAIAERLAVQHGDEGVVVASLRRDGQGRSAVLGELGKLYSAGYPVDWRKVYGTTGPMVELPAYPWQRERCWLDDKPARRRGSAGGHPVLESCVESAVAPQARHWVTPVDLAGFGFLRDHQVGGNAVLPAALVLDAALAAARGVLGHPEGTVDVTVEDVRFTRMTVVPEAVEDPTLQLVFVPETADGGSFRFFSRPDGASAWAEIATGRYRGSAPRGDGAHETLATVLGRCPQETPADAHYTAMANAGLGYGPAFQGIAELRRGEREAVGRLRDRRELTREPGAYLVHPCVLDSCMQVLAAALDDTPSGIHLPVRVGRFRLAENAVPRWAHAVPGAGGDARIVLYGDDGTAVGELTGLVLEELDQGTGAERGDPRYEVDWAEAEATAPDDLDEGWWLIFTDRGGVCGELRTAVAGAGGACVTVAAGEGLRKLSRTRYEADPARREDIAELLAALRADGLAPTRVVYGWGLDAELPETTEDPLDAVDACARALHLVQELVRDSENDDDAEPPSLALLTRGAQHTPGQQNIATAQAPLWGLARVLLLEHGELRPRIVDLDPAGPDGEADALLDELLRPGDDQVALRDGKRLTPRLRPLAGTEAGASWPRRPADADRYGDNHRLLAERPGSLDSLTPTWSRRCAPGPGEVEIEVTAAGLNFSDVLKAMGTYPGASGTVPLGAECAGRVSAVGAGVAGLSAGDPVIAVAANSMAGYVTTPATHVAPKPAALTDEEAAATPIAFLTAIHCLEHLARIREGETVLIHSATGGVGLAALQVARRNGARVFATAGNDDKRALLRSLGVELVMDSRSLAFADEITAATGGRGVDVVLNSLTGEALTRSLALLAPGGRFVEIGKQDVYRDSHVGLGFFKHNRSFHAVDIEQSVREEPELIARLLRELTAGYEAGEFTALPVTGYADTDAQDAFRRMAQAQHIGKLVLRPGAHREAAVQPGTGPVRPGATYLITGGLGALGLATARHLAAQGAGHLVLAGRSGPSPEAERELAQLRETAEVVTVAADVSHPAEVARVLAEIDRAMPPLAGVVHAAGTLDDGMLRDLDPGRFRTVGAAKAAGAWHLHRACRDRRLDFFVLYSSAASVLGSASQGNYAAANAFLDALAWHRESQGLPATSINWGPWSGGGLAAVATERGTLAARGIESLSPEEGIAALDLVLRGTATQPCVLPMDRQKLASAVAGGLLRGLLATVVADAQGTAEDGGTGGNAVRQEMLAVEPGRRRRAVLTRHCREEAARVLGLEPERIDPEVPLANLGFDSLLSLQLRKGLETSLQVTLPATITWRFPTVAALVPFLAERMGIALEAESEVGQ
jgi:phthiocerol/phenolphthiocerol synthesis type-I polyketide synthase C